jgi:hypothetical protein
MEHPYLWRKGLFVIMRRAVELCGEQAQYDILSARF